MAEIRCPMCGKLNPPDLDQCQFCEARLKPLIAPSPPDDFQPIFPGDLDSGAELEDQTAEERGTEPETSPATPVPERESSGWLDEFPPDNDDDETPFDEGDLDIPGLPSEEKAEETPDWLSRIRGGAEAAPEEPETPAAPEETAAPPESETGFPDWLSAIRGEPEEAEPPSPERGSQLVGTDLPAWFSESAGEEEGAAPAEEASGPIPEDLSMDMVPSEAMETREVPGLSFRDEAEDEDRLPTWLTALGEEPPEGEEVTPTAPETLPSAPDEPDWAAAMAAEAAALEPKAEEPEEEAPQVFPIGAQEEPLERAAAQAPEEADEQPVPPTEPEEEPPGAEGGRHPEWAVAADWDAASGWAAGMEPEEDREEEPQDQAPPEASDEEEPHTGELPEWLQESEPEEEAWTFESTPGPAGEGEIPDWTAAAAAGAAGEVPPEEEVPPEGLETKEIPGLSFEGEAEEGELPDWLQELEPEEEAWTFESAPGAAAEVPIEEEVPPETLETKEIPGLSFEGEAEEGELPDWLQELEAEEAGVLDLAEASAEIEVGEEPTEGLEEAPDEEGSPGWIAAAGAAVAGALKSDETAGPPAEDLAPGELPDWLQDKAEEPAEPAGAVERPGWFEAEEAGPEALEAGDVPVWLRDLQEAQQEAVTDSEDIDLAGLEPPVSPFSEEEEVPEWVDELRVGVPPVGPGEEIPPEPSLEEGPPEPDELVPEEGIPLGATDWASQLAAAEEDLESAALEGDLDLEPAELPGWLQAMRPIEAVTPSGPGGAGGDIEGVGPLAGLSGILPAEPEITQTGKPPSFSMRVEITKNQYEHINLLKDLIQGEAQPRLEKSGIRVARPQRILRWVIALLLFVAVGAPLLLGLDTMPLPTLVPQETLAVGEIIGSLPQGETVLVAFDYQPGLSAELDATSAAVLDHLMLRGVPLALVSTVPTGPALAERVFANPTVKAEHGYLHGDQYINLGYIPGGAAGLLAFSLNPQRTLPVPFNLEGISEPYGVWSTPPLAGIQSLSDFALLVVLVDDPSTARAWVEQVEPSLGDVPLVMVSSAQAVPFIRPYYNTSPPQVDGIVAGIPGGVAYERITGRSLLARTYWEAFGNGLILAGLLLLVGGVLSYGMAYFRRSEVGEKETPDKGEAEA